VVAVSAPGLAVSAGAGNPGPSAEAPGATVVRMLHLRLSAGSAQGIRLQSLALSASGSGNDATELGTVTLWRDTGGNGLVDLGDAQAGTGTFTADDGSILFDLSAEPVIPAGGSVLYLAVASLQATAVAGSTFAFTVSPALDVVSEGATTSAAVTAEGNAVSGGPVTAATSGAGSLSLVPGPNNPAARGVGAPAQGVSMLQAILAASSLEAVKVSRVRVSAAGSGDDGRIATASLIVDIDEDGRVSAGETALATATFSANDGTADFGPLTLEIAAGGRVVFLVALDFGSDLSAGTYALSIASAPDVWAEGSTSRMGILATGAPVQGNTVTVGSNLEMDPVFFFGGCGGGAGAGGAAAGWALLALATLAALGAARCRIARR
jgi:hypothetical protein